MNLYRTTLLLATLSAAPAAMSDWSQWRGSDRNGFVSSGQLIESLPSDGLAPVWRLDSFPGGSSGGWSSPVISDGRVFLYGHTKTKNPDVDLEQSKFPWLSPDKRVGMTDEEYEAYEVKRRDENERRSKAFRFEERLVCLDLATGEIIWDKVDTSKYTRFVQSGTPCVAGGRVFVLGAERTARCYDASTGNVLWNRRLPGDFRDEYFSSSFTVVGDSALIACGPLVALSTQDGALQWQGDTPLDYQSHSSPAVWLAGSEAIAIVNTAGGKTQAYRVVDGEKLWELKAGAGHSTPIISGDLLLTYGSSRKSGLSAYRLVADAPAKQPELEWQFQRAADSGSTPVVRQDAVFVQGEKRLAKVSLADGDTQWQTTMKISNPRYTSLVAAGDQVFFGWEGLLAFKAEGDKFVQLYDAKVDSEGMLITADDLREKLDLDRISAEPDGLEQSEKLWQQKAVKSGPLACSSPAVSDGRMVIRLRDAVVCFDLRQSSL